MYVKRGGERVKRGWINIYMYGNWKSDNIN